MFFSAQFPEYQKVVLEILQSYEFVDNVIKGDYIAQIRNTFKGKEQANALKFAAFTVKEAETIGKEQALSLKLPFDEREALQNNFTFLFENMPTITG